MITRYVHRLKNKSLEDKASESYVNNDAAFALNPKGKGRYSMIFGSQDMGTSQHVGNAAEEFDPGVLLGEERSRSLGYDRAVNHPSEAGYGGGFWTHSEIQDEEKARLKRKEIEAASSEMMSVGEAPASGSGEPEDLPRYTLG